MTARYPQHQNSIFEPRWDAASEYGVPTGSLPVSGSAPVPGKTDPAELRGTVTMSKRKLSRAFVQN